MGLERTLQIGEGTFSIEKCAKRFLRTIGTVFLASALAFIPVAYASEKQETRTKDEIHQKIVLGNCLLQGAISGFGGMQNGESYWKSFAKGCLGGTLIAGGKIAVGNDLNNAWLGKMATSFGSSISYNASSGRPIDDSFGADFGPAFLEWKKNNYGSYNFNAYLLPDSAAYLMSYLSEGDKIDAELSLRHGTPILISDGISHPVEAYGLSGANIIRILDKKRLGNILECERGIDCTDNIHSDKEEIQRDWESILNHELIHTHQYTSTRSFGKTILDIGNFRKARKKFFEPLHVNLDHWVGDYLSSFALGYNGAGNKSLEEEEAYALSGHLE